MIAEKLKKMEIARKAFGLFSLSLVGVFGYGGLFQIEIFVIFGRLDGRFGQSDG